MAHSLLPFRLHLRHATASASSGETRPLVAGDRVEYEYEFSDNKRKAPRVILTDKVHGGSGSATSSSPFSRARDSRGVRFESVHVHALSLPLLSSLLCGRGRFPQSWTHKVGAEDLSGVSSYGPCQEAIPYYLTAALLFCICSVHFPCYLAAPLSLSVPIPFAAISF